MSADQASFGFAVQVVRNPGEEGDVSRIRIDQRVWELMTMIPRTGSGEKRQNILWDGNGVRKITDEGADQEVKFWAKTGADFWIPKRFFPDITTDKASVGTPAKGNMYRIWLLNPEYDKKVVKKSPAVITYLDAPGFRNTPAKDWLELTLRFAAEIKATGTDGSTRTAQFFVKIVFESDGKTWKVKGTPAVDPPDIVTGKRGKYFIK